MLYVVRPTRSLHLWTSQVVPWMGLPRSTAGKGSTCNAGDPSSIPGSGSSPGEGIVYPLQYSCACLVTQMVKNPPAMQETGVWSLGWDDPLEEDMATHSSILAWRIPMDRGAWRAIVHGGQRVRHDWVITHSIAQWIRICLPMQLHRFNPCSRIFHLLQGN